MGIKFIVGLAMGAAAYHFLHTEDGKAFITKMQKNATDLGGDLATLAEDLVQKGRSFAEQIKPSAN
jgi:hypothetical protein